MSDELARLMPDPDRRAVAVARLLVRTQTGRGIRNGSSSQVELRVMDQNRDSLTERERQVVAALAAGLSRQETADVLGVGLETVKTALGHAKRRLRAKSTAQVTANAVRAGVIE